MTDPLEQLILQGVGRFQHINGNNFTATPGTAAAGTGFSVGGTG